MSCKEKKKKMKQTLLRDFANRKLHATQISTISSPSTNPDCAMIPLNSKRLNLQQHRLWQVLLFTPSPLSSSYHIVLSPLFLITFPSSSASLYSEKKEDKMHTQPNLQNIHQFRIVWHYLIKNKNSRLNSLRITVHRVLTKCVCVFRKKMTAGEFLNS